jgi:hypothetical protein
MEKIRASRPSPGIVVAVLALVAALAGTAIAGTPATTSAINKKKVKKIATKQINKLAPTLSVASADTAGSADTATTADTAANAQSASNAGALQGKPASAFASASEPYHEVGTSGEPDFVNGWDNVVGPFSKAGFYKDSQGVVHLKGNIDTATGDGAGAFTLPPGYRPSEFLIMPAGSVEAAAAQLGVSSNGGMNPTCFSAGTACEVGIDGLTFRAG